MDVSWMKNGKLLTGGELDGNLFNVEDDPEERVNLYDDPGSQKTVKHLLSLLDNWWGSMEKPVDLFGANQQE
jgi:hypothetical protein